VIDKRLLQLKDTIDSLGFLLKSPPEGMLDDADQERILEGVGISDAVRIVLKEAQIPLTPSELKTFLSSRHFDFSAYKNTMAVLHNTLKRLAMQGELVALTRNDGQVLYTFANEQAKK
jgi:hypothetical protein